MSEAFSIYNKNMSIENERGNLKREEELKEIIGISDDYRVMTNTPGWTRFRKIIDERISAKSELIFSAKDEKQMWRLQGEGLALKSLMKIIDASLEDARLAKIELEQGE